MNVPVERPDAERRPPGIPNPDIMRKDPMAELFGPGSPVKKVGDPEDDVPDEIRAVLEEHGLSRKSFQCMLKEIPAGTNVEGETGSQNSRYIKGWTRSVPSIEYIAKTYGPGMYVLSFSWRMMDEGEDGKRESRAMRQEVPLEISPKFADEYKKHRINAKIQEASEVSTNVRDTLIEKKVEGQMLKALTGEDGEKTNPAQAAKQYLTETLETVKMLGFPLLNQQAPIPAPRIEWDKIIPAIAPLVTAFLTMQQQAENRRADDFNKMLMLMMSQSQQANTQLIEMMKAHATGTGNSQTAIKEYTDMIHGVIDIKEALSGYGKESLGDKIFRVVEGVAPQILSIAATAAQAQAAKNSVPVKMAKGYIEQDPDFQALKQNPVEMKNFIDKMDGFFGWEQTDVILAVAEWPRPDDCPRDPDRKQPPNMQQGGSGEAADAITGDDA